MSQEPERPEQAERREQAQRREQAGGGASGAPGGLGDVAGELAAISATLEAGRPAALAPLAVALERRLPAAGEAPRLDPASALALRRELLRTAALLEATAVYRRARLSLEQPPGEAYGPNGAPRGGPRGGHRSGRRTEA